MEFERAPTPEADIPAGFHKNPRGIELALKASLDMKFIEMIIILFFKAFVFLCSSRREALSPRVISMKFLLVISILENRPFLHYTPVSKHKEMRTRLGWTISYKSLYFVHSSLKLVPLFTDLDLDLDLPEEVSILSLTAEGPRNYELYFLEQHI